ncbi:hypothetical protein AU210_016411 [Fusarium oxysporum f. sp. radicis-cucumerinum]|uniref:Uncharacterized protein n=1 Tax=Fusarium oxysporum f. sp. radicis-cucumerinum TaxID=327505 RepID=A0A2H3G8P2_FUSOX|nr:hypothetical protein AU210_016411 [Fusarium oxysporum f. sp. radicis-cucumerinum]
MCITHTHTRVHSDWCIEHWSLRTLCTNSRHGQVCPDHQVEYVPAPYTTPQRNSTAQCRPATPSIPSVSYRSGDKSDHERRGHSPGPHRQEPIIQVEGPSHSSSTIRRRYPIPKTEPPVIDDERTRPPEQHRVRFKEVNNHRHFTKDSRNSNSASDSRQPDGRECRTHRRDEKLQQEAELHLQTRIAEANAKIASRPAALHRRVEVMNPHSQDYHAEKFHHVSSEQQAQRDRLRERMRPKRRLTVGGWSGRPGETGTYRYE